MGYEVSLNQPESLSGFVDHLLNISGLYGYCEKCICSDRLMIVLENNVISPQSCMGKILSVEGVGEKQDSDSYRKFKIDFDVVGDWTSNPYYKTLREALEQMKD